MDRYYFFIKHNGLNYYHSLCNLYDYNIIDHEGTVFLHFVKHHDHRYELHGFFYAKKLLVGPYFFRSKRELYGAIQKLLQELL